MAQGTKKVKKTEKIKLITERLKESYKDADCSLSFSSPFQLLIATRLSAQCTDKRVNLVTPDLFESYKTPADLAAADVLAVSDIIKSCGLYKTKAESIVGISRMLMADFGGRVPDTMEGLLKLPGIGRKTANLVLGEVYGDADAVVTDTHVIRISNRLGLVGTKDPIKVESALRRIVPKGEGLDLCHRMVHFGRDICRAASPGCGKCFLCDVCVAFKGA